MSITQAPQPDSDDDAVGAPDLGVAAKEAGVDMSRQDLRDAVWVGYTLGVEDRVKPAPAEGDVLTDDQAIELASALELHRAVRIVADVAALPIGGKEADKPTQFQAGYQVACEEIAERIRTEVHVLPGGLTLPGCGPLPSVRQPADAVNVQPKGTAEPVGVVGSMPGTTGFTMACFKAADVPIGTKLYAGPVQSPAPVDEEPTAIVHWPLNGPPRLVWYSTEAMNAAVERGLQAQNGYVSDLKLYAHAPCAAVGAEDARDAARYRWLRDKPMWHVDIEDDTPPRLMKWSVEFTSHYGATETEDSLDACIDAATRAGVVMQHPKQIAGVGCALCGRNEAGYYCTGDCGEYQEGATHPPVQGSV